MASWLITSLALGGTEDVRGPIHNVLICRGHAYIAGVLTCGPTASSEAANVSNSALL